MSHTKVPYRSQMAKHVKLQERGIRTINKTAVHDAVMMNKHGKVKKVKALVNTYT